jgi:hypothetical protein
MSVNIEEKVHIASSGTRSYTCGHCNTYIDGQVIAYNHARGADRKVHVYEGDLWLRCTSCRKGTCFVDGFQFPGIPYGPKIEGLPDKVKPIYSEIRECMKISAFTAAEMLCRKIIMNISAEEGAGEDRSFVEYIEFLSEKQIVTNNMKPWLEQIKSNGGKSTHEFDPADRKRAESTVWLTATLLQIVYEAPHKMNLHMPKPPT